MGENLMMADSVRLCSWIPSAALALLPWWAPARRKRARCIPTWAEAPGLIERDPVFHSVTKFFKANLSIVLVVVADSDI